MDRESQTHKPQTLSSFYSSKPAAGSQRSPSKHAAAATHGGVSGATGGVSKHTPSCLSATAMATSSTSLPSAAPLTGEEVGHQAELKAVQNSSAGESCAETREHGENPPPKSLCLLILFEKHSSVVFISCWQPDPLNTCPYVCLLDPIKLTNSHKNLVGFMITRCCYRLSSFIK